MKNVYNILKVFQNYYEFPNPESKQVPEDKFKYAPTYKPKYESDIQKSNPIKPVNTTLTVEGFTFESRHTHEKYQSINTNEYFKNVFDTYTIYHNTDENTVVCFSKESIYGFQEQLVILFPELTKLGEVGVKNEDTIVNLIRDHTDKHAMDLWNIIQTHYSILLPPNISPSRDRLESTIHKIYTLNTKRKDSIPYKSVLERIIKELYGENTTPNPTSLKTIKRTLPSILKKCGLDKKRMAEGFHWYGMKDKAVDLSENNVSLDKLYETMMKDRNCTT
jgi:hypothetical protein